MGSLFIAGNGFDIAHGIPTRYSDFRTFIVNQYPEALEFRDATVFLEDWKDIEVYEFAAEILLSTMDKMAGENWCNFEEALAHINFNDKFPRVVHKQNESEDEDMGMMGYYLLYLDVLSSGFINCSKIWQDFFRAWIKSIQAQIDDNVFSEKKVLRDLFTQSDMQFLTFNYTKTLQKIYGIKKVVHIHNRVGQKLIFGHEKDDATYDQYDCDPRTELSLGSSFLDDMIMSFKKDTETPMKKYSDFFKKLDSKIDKVYSYGFSFGKVDSVYIKRIVSSISPDAVWHFTAFEAQDSESLRIKKVKLRRYGFKGSFDVYGEE